MYPDVSCPIIPTLKNPIFADIMDIFILYPKLEKSHIFFLETSISIFYVSPYTGVLKCGYPQIRAGPRSIENDKWTLDIWVEEKRPLGSAYPREIQG